jgi:hypothetical protein
MVLGVAAETGDRHVTMGDELDREQRHDDQGDDG